VSVELHDFAKAEELLLAADNIYCDMKKKYLIKPMREQFWHERIEFTKNLLSPVIERSLLKRNQTSGEFQPFQLQQAVQEECPCFSKKSSQRIINTEQVAPPLNEVVRGASMRNLMVPNRSLASNINRDIAFPKPTKQTVFSRPEVQQVSQLEIDPGVVDILPASVSPGNTFILGTSPKTNNSPSFEESAASLQLIHSRVQPVSSPSHFKLDEFDVPAPLATSKGYFSHNDLSLLIRNREELDSSVFKLEEFTNAADLLEDKDIDDSDPRPLRISVLNKDSSGCYPTPHFKTGITLHMEMVHVDTFFIRAEMNRIRAELSRNRKRRNSISLSSDYVFVN
jgi:hypothetical protein